MSYERQGVGSNRRADILLIVGFFTILLYPSLALFETPDALKARGAAEQRTLAARPPIWQLATTPSEYVSGFKSFFEDHFEGRDELVTLNSLVRYRAFRESSSSQVVVGKHGALFFTGEAFVRPYDFGHEVAKYRRILPVTERRLRGTHEFLLKRKQWAEEMGAKFLFVISPDKSTIYPEDMPDRLTRLDRPSFTDDLVAYLNAKGDIDFLDLRPVMKDAKRSRKPLYYVRDTHWNNDGARLAFNEVQDWIRDRFPSIRPLTDDDYTRKPVRTAGDLSALLHLEGHLREFSYASKLKSPRAASIPFFGDPTPIPTWEHPPLAFQTGDPTLPKALIYHDSFFVPIMPSLSELFQTTVFIRDRRVFKRTVWNFKPDVLIFECVERNLFPLAYWTDELIPTVDPRMIAEQTDLFVPRVR